MAEQTSRSLLASGEEALTEASMCTGSFAEPRHLLEACASLAATEGDRHTEAAAIDRLGVVVHYENIMRLVADCKVSEVAAAAEEAMFRRALAIRQELGDHQGVAQSLFGIGLVFQVLRGDWATAVPLFRDACEIVDAVTDGGDLYLRSEVHRHLGFFFLVEDLKPAEAVRQLTLSLELREQLGDPRRVPSGLVALAKAEMAAGDAIRAVELLDRAVADAHAAGLLSHWITAAEDALRQAEAAVEASHAGP